MELKAGNVSATTWGVDMASLLNMARVRAYLLDEAKTQGKPRLARVSASTLVYLERELVKDIGRLVSMSPHGGPKTIFPPS